MESGGVDWWFIAAQAPMPNTVADFWQLIWEYNVHVVAMLTDIVVSVYMSAGNIVVGI